MDWSSLIGIISGLGQAGMGIYQGFGGGYNDPTKKASERLGQIPGQAEPYYSPYINAGKGAMDTLNNQNKDLLSGGKQNQLGESYKESPGYQARLRAAMTAGSNAAASGGYLGTPVNQEDMMNRATDVASQDYDTYMRNQIGLYDTGYGGTKDINQQGFDASKGMADTVSNVTGQQAGLDYVGDAGRNTYKQGGWKNAFSGGAQAASSAAGIPPWLIQAIQQFSQSQGKGV